MPKFSGQFFKFLIKNIFLKIKIVIFFYIFVKYEYNFKNNKPPYKVLIKIMTFYREIETKCEILKNCNFSNLNRSLIEKIENFTILLQFILGNSYGF